MDFTVNIFHPFNVPPYDMGRMMCAINAIIEVFELPVEKMTVPDAAILVQKIIMISGSNLSPAYYGEFLSGLIQDIIDRKCRNLQDKDKVMNLCAQKYSHFNLTRQLI